MFFSPCDCNGFDGVHLHHKKQTLQRPENADNSSQDKILSSLRDNRAGLGKTQIKGIIVFYDRPPAPDYYCGIKLFI